MNEQNYRTLARKLEEYGDDLNKKYKRTDRTIHHRGADAILHLIACHRSKDRTVDHLMAKPWKSAGIAWTLLCIETLLLVVIITALFGAV